MPRLDPAPETDRDLALGWSARLSLTARILVVNIIALAMLAGGFFYLDSFRARILDSRVQEASREARLIADGLASADADERDRLLRVYAAHTGNRIRVYARDGRLLADTRAMGSRNAVLIDPDKEGWQQNTARILDAVIDRVVVAARAPLYRERGANSGLAWPDVQAALDPTIARASVWRAPDRTPVITAAAQVSPQAIVFTTANALDVTQRVRVERFRLSVVLAIVTLLSIFLSLFLARTIVRPLRRLARAAVRVRLGRAREVVVPRLPDRRDEIGMLARALSDMSGALRDRIDATEAFAADVTHELKNPLASIRSAVDGLARVEDPHLRAQLIAIIGDDARRLDRLITDISDASRLDAEMSRTTFEPVDIGAMIAAMVAARRERGIERGVTLRFDHAPSERLEAMGLGSRLERVFDNLIDNALSFAPDGSEIAIAGRIDDDTLAIRVEDEGPGVPTEQRDAIFRRFHSVRPGAEPFGSHSGLGLAIARTIVEAHGGRIMVESRDNRSQGASFLVELPRMDRA